MYDRLLKDVKVFALAGGTGSRLLPLTERYAKPAVPFLGVYVIFDFVMWCLFNSGLRNVGVLVQKNAVSLTDHMAAMFPRKPGGGTYFQALSPEGYDGRDRFCGTADAVWQHLHHARGYDTVMIVSGDHIFKADFGKFYSFHTEHDADLTIMAITTTVEEAREFGVIKADSKNKIIDFVEKPILPLEIPSHPGHSYCSMGVYCWKKKVLEAYLEADARDENSSHDFARDIIVKMIADGRKVYAFPFSETTIDGQKPYWRDIGTLRAYWEEHMNFCSNAPTLNMYSEVWEIPPRDYMVAPNKFGDKNTINNTHIPSGCIINGTNLLYSVLGTKVTIRSGCNVVQSIIPSQVSMEHDCVLHKTILVSDPNLRRHQRLLIPAGTQIGVDHKDDIERGFKVTEEGIVVVPFAWFKMNEQIITVE